MSDQILESGQNASTLAPGQGQSAGASGGQPPSNGQDVPEHIRQYIERKLQTDKDRRINRIEKRQDDFDSRLAAYEEYRATGMSPAQARRQMKIDAMLEEREPQGEAETFPTRSATPEPARPTEVRPTRLFEVLGIDPNDPDALDLAFQYGNKPEVLKSKLVDYKMNFKAPAPANPAAVVAPTGGTQTPNEQAALRQQYETEIKKIPRGGRAPEHLIALKQKYRKLGLPV